MEIVYFLSQSSRRCGEMMAFLSALRNIGNCEDVKLKYFSLWRDSSLCCASFRMTRFCFLLTIRNLNYFWNAKIFFILIMFLRKQSWRNSFALKRMEIDAGYEVRVTRCEYFYHKVHGVMVKWWRFWGHWGTLEIVKMWSWNILLFEEILHYAVLRSEWQSFGL